MIETILQLVKTHPILLLLIAVTWLTGQAITALVGAIPAPTKDSTPKQIFWFTAANLFVGNIQRAFHTALEKSPNWPAALAKHKAESRAGAVTDGTVDSE